MDRPLLKPSLHAQVVEPEGVYLLSEHRHFVLRGRLHRLLVPLLDGRRTVDELVDALAGQASPAEVYYAIALLEQKGYVEEGAPEVPAERAAFWSAVGLPAGAAERRLRAATVSVCAFGGLAVEPFAASLAALGIRVGADGELAVALTDDYLQPELEGLNGAALDSGRPWLLVKPLGTEAWIGPLFRPGHTACWECLAQRLRVNRPVQSYLQRRQGRTAPITVARAALPTTVQAALALAATEAARVLGGAPPPAPHATLTTLDLGTLETTRHAVVRRPQCPRCGAGPARAQREPVPLVLRSRPKGYAAGGGHRAVPPEQTLARFGHHVSPISGAVSALTRIPVDEDGRLHVYLAGDNRAIRADSLHGLRRGLRSKSAGKGVTDAQARASALCEGLERYCGGFQGDEIRLRDSYRRLGGHAIHPNACMLFSAAQYAQREAWNARGGHYAGVPEPFDEDAEVEWTPVWSLTRQAFRLLPTAYCYFRYPDPAATASCWSDSNGCAAGNTVEEAVLQGLMELVERDSVALWWYSRARRPAVDLESFDEPYVGELRALYARMGRDVWALDLTSDLGIPAFAAVTRRGDAPAEQIVFGFGAHFDPRTALLRALTEMTQILPHVLPAGRPGQGQPDLDDPDARRWWAAATLASQPYLAPDERQPPRRLADFPRLSHGDVLEDLRRCQTVVEDLGLELLVLDQTRPDIGLPVVKVIVPGLRHFWARFAPGRLYDVPARLGWVPAPLTEDELNPVSMFL